MDNAVIGLMYIMFIALGIGITIGLYHLFKINGNSDGYSRKIVTSMYNYDVGLETVANLETFTYYCSNCGYDIQRNLFEAKETLYIKCRACSVDKEKHLFVLESI
jgi:DNA-directed RNA polymerase subunit RPC12/RpoP